MRVATVIAGKCLLSAGFACIIVINTKAQTAATVGVHTLTAGAGMQVLKDDVLSLSSEKINTTSLTWSFSNNNGYRKKNILAGFEKGISSLGKNTLHSSEFVLQYTNAFSLVKNKSSRWNNYTGYSISVNPKYMESGDRYSWASVNSVSFYNSLEHSWQKSSVLLGISVPLAGFGSRPGLNATYKGSVNDMLYNSFSNLEFTSLHNLKAINISLQYQQAITGRLSVTAGGSYSYKDMKINDSFLQQGYEVHAGLSYHAK